jgi:hypothetical protein
VPTTPYPSYPAHRDETGTSSLPVCVGATQMSEALELAVLSDGASHPTLFTLWVVSITSPFSG